MPARSSGGRSHAKRSSSGESGGRSHARHTSLKSKLKSKSKNSKSAARAKGSRSASARATRGGKVGSSRRAARSVGGKNDFGVSAGEETHRQERLYVSAETKHSDPGGRQPRSSTLMGNRVAGAGGPDAGPGSNSGGDIDTDIIGVGTGGSGVAQSGPDRTEGADISTDPVNEFASGPPAKRQGDPLAERAESRRRGRRGGKAGREILPNDAIIDRSGGGDATTTGDGQGAAAATNPNVRDDDAFAGEISLDEAGGADNSPSDRL